MRPHSSSPVGKLVDDAKSLLHHINERGSWLLILILLALSFFSGYTLHRSNPAVSTVTEEPMFLSPQEAAQVNGVKTSWASPRMQTNKQQPNIQTSANNTKTQDVFSNIYATSFWGSEGGGSGLGSNLEWTKRIRLIVELLVCKLGVRAMIDAPCGAMVWMPLALERIERGLACPTRLYSDFYYHGVDIVPSVIASNQQKFAAIPNWQFSVLDFSKDAIPGGYDLIFSRDALQHLSYDVITKALQNFATSPAKFLAVGSYKEGNNTSIEIGGYFPIDLRRPPFSLDFPIDVLDEETPDGKVVLLYKTEDLRRVNFKAMRRRAGLGGGKKEGATR